MRKTGRAGGNAGSPRLGWPGTPSRTVRQPAAAMPNPGSEAMAEPDAHPRARRHDHVL
jgi:hypothetical protein